LFPIPWYAVLLISVPETFLIIKIGFNLFNLDVDSWKSLLIALITGVIIYFIRLMPLMFGVHTLIGIVLLTILVAIFEKIDLWDSFVSVLLGFIIFGVIENVVLTIFLNITSKTINDLALNPWLNILSFLPTLIMVLILYGLIKRFKFIIFDLKMKGTA